MKLGIAFTALGSIIGLWLIVIPLTIALFIGNVNIYQVAYNSTIFLFAGVPMLVYGIKKIKRTWV